MVNLFGHPLEGHVIATDTKIIITKEEIKKFFKGLINERLVKYELVK